MFASRTPWMVGLALLASAFSAHAANVALVPISASGTHSIVGQEIRLTGAGQRVRFELRVSGFAPDQIKTYQGTIDSAGDPLSMCAPDSTGYTHPPQPGTLSPALVACAADATCVTAFGTGSTCAKYCNGGANDNLPCVSDPGCPGGTCVPERCEAGFLDTTRADFLFAGITAICAVNTFTPDYAFGCTTISASNAMDPGTPRYSGTLLLDVSANAVGSFTINFKCDKAATFYQNQNDLNLSFTRIPAVVTVLCSNAAQCNDGNACTTDTCNGSGLCVNTPNYDTTQFCCAPISGNMTPLSDGNVCTQDKCNPVNGTVTHPPENAGFACGSSSNTQCDNPDTCNGAGTCVPNFELPGFACGSATNTDCNGADTCDGSGTCQTNIRPPGFACGSPASGPCDNPDTCNGLGTCLVNQSANGTPCDDGLFCVDGTSCSNGNCTGGSPHSCDDLLTCTTDVCNETTNQCDNTLDANRCLIANVCFLEGALNPLNTCEECDSATNTADWTVLPDGSLCNDGNACTGTGRPNIDPDTCALGECAGEVDPECNDDCEFAVVAVEGANLSNNSSAGPDDGEASCQPDSNNDVWFKYTALCDGLVFASTTGSNLLPLNDPVLNVFTNCPQNGGVEIACDDDGGLDLNAALTFSTTMGSTYLIRVAGFENNRGDIVMNIRPFDDCVIDGVCYSEDDLNPMNPCQACLPDVSTTQWTNLAEATLCGDLTDDECDSPDACNGAGVCELNYKPDGTACPDEIPGNVCSKNLCAAGTCTHPPEPVGLPCGSPGNTDCDNPDTCDGGGSCDPNFEDAGFACGDQNQYECDNPDICDVVGNCLDNLKPDGTECDDFDVCTDQELCVNGVCVGDPIPDAPLVEGLGGRNLLVTPQPPASAAPVALHLTSPTWTCVDKYINFDGTLGDFPMTQLPNLWGTVLVRGVELYPSAKFIPSIYEVRAECGIYVSPPGSDATWVWGDLDNDGDADFMDIGLIVDEWRFQQSAVNPEVIFDLYPCPGDNRLDFRDIAADTDAFRGLPYPCPEPCP